MKDRVEFVGGPRGPFSAARDVRFEDLPQVFKVGVRELPDETVIGADVYDLRKTANGFRYEYRETVCGSTHELDLTDSVLLYYTAKQLQDMEVRRKAEEVHFVGSPRGPLTLSGGLPFQDLPQVFNLPVREDLEEDWCARIIGEEVYDLRKTESGFRYEYRETKYGSPNELDLTDDLRLRYTAKQLEEEVFVGRVGQIHFIGAPDGPLAVPCGLSIDDLPRVFNLPVRERIGETARGPAVPGVRGMVCPILPAVQGWLGLS